MKQIAHELDSCQSAAFTEILATAYREYDFRPALCRLACIEYAGQRYLAATDGMAALFLPAPATLDLGDYQGVPYLVRCDDPPAAPYAARAGEEKLYPRIQSLFKLIRNHEQVDLYEHDNVENIRASLNDDTEVMLAHVADGKFIFDHEQRHTHIISREKYDYLSDAVGYFDEVHYGKPDEVIAFWNSKGRGFALLMPIKPNADAKITKTRGG